MIGTEAGTSTLSYAPYDLSRKVTSSVNLMFLFWFHHPEGTHWISICIAYPDPYGAWIAQLSLMQIVMDGHDAPFSKLLQQRQYSSLFLPPNCRKGLKSLEFVSKLSSGSMTVLSTLAHILFFKKKNPSTKYSL